MKNVSKKTPVHSSTRSTSSPSSSSCRRNGLFCLQSLTNQLKMFDFVVNCGLG